MSNLPENLPSDVMSALDYLNAQTRLGVDDLKLMALVECSGEPFYNALADSAPDAGCADLLRKNGREERAHAHRCKKAIEILTGEPFELVRDEANPYCQGPLAPGCDPGFLEMLKGLEMNGDGIYQGWAENEPNEEVATLLRQNGKEETRHGERVAQVLERLAAV